MSAVQTPSSSPPTLTSSLPRRPSSTPTRNPISLRLHKVLASSFDDEASREALETVSAFYGSSTLPASAEHDPATNGKEGSRPSEQWEGAAERARRGLRRDGEERLAESSRKFLEAFGQVDKVRASSRACHCNHAVACEFKVQGAFGRGLWFYSCEYESILTGVVQRKDLEYI